MIKNPLFNLTGDPTVSIEHINRMVANIGAFALGLSNTNITQEIQDAMILEYAKTILHVHEWNATTEDTTNTGANT